MPATITPNPVGGAGTVTLKVTGLTFGPGVGQVESIRYRVNTAASWTSVGTLYNTGTTFTAQLAAPTTPGSYTVDTETYGVDATGTRVLIGTTSTPFTVTAGLTVGDPRFTLAQCPPDADPGLDAELAGWLCDINADGEVIGGCWSEIIYDEVTGQRVGTRLIDPITGDTYVPQGVAIVRCPENPLYVQAHDCLANGTCVNLLFNPATGRNYTPTLLGAPALYSPQGSWGLEWCEIGLCNNCERTERLCDVVTATATFAAPVVTINGVVWTTGTATGSRIAVDLPVTVTGDTLDRIITSYGCGYVDRGVTAGYDFTNEPAGHYQIVRYFRMLSGNWIQRTLEFDWDGAGQRFTGLDITETESPGTWKIAVGRAFQKYHCDQTPDGNPRAEGGADYVVTGELKIACPPINDIVEPRTSDDEKPETRIADPKPFCVDLIVPAGAPQERWDLARTWEMRGGQLTETWWDMDETPPLRMDPALFDRTTITEGDCCDCECDNC